MSLSEREEISDSGSRVQEQLFVKDEIVWDRLR